MEFKAKSTIIDTVKVLRRTNGIPTSILVEGLGMIFYLPPSAKGNALVAQSIKKDRFHSKITIKTIKKGKPYTIEVERIEGIYAFSSVQKEDNTELLAAIKKKRNRARNERRKKLRLLKSKVSEELSENFANHTTRSDG